MVGLLAQVVTTPTVTSSTAPVAQSDPADTTNIVRDEIATNASNIPGSEQALEIVEGLLGWGLILALAALVCAAVIWAFASFTQNQASASAGKKGVLVAAGCAVLIGAAPTLVDWAYQLGTEVTSS